MERRTRRRETLLVLVVGALLVTNVGLFARQQPREPTSVSEVTLVYPVENGSAELWPYTSRARSFDRATLPINVVVHASASTVYRLLVAGGGTNLMWNESETRWQVGDSGETTVKIRGDSEAWATSSGANRYTYVRTPAGATWTTATYQVHDGHYFGRRIHLRIYGDTTENASWSAIQAHREHWDWFRLRHSVGSLSRGQHAVERYFLGSGLLRDVSRERFGNGGAIDADGWVTVIEFRPAVAQAPATGPAATPRSGQRSRTAVGFLVVPVVALALLPATVSWPGHVESVTERAADARVGPAHLGLALAMAAFPLGVRVAAIAAENAYPFASPYAVGAPFYLLLALGLPAVATAFGRRLPADEGFTLTVLGLGTGFMADYAYLHITALPYGAVVQRFVLLVGLGLVAAGGVRWATDPVERHRYRLVGMVVWVGALLWPLVG